MLRRAMYQIFSNVKKFWDLCPIHVVTFTLISNLATDHIQKRTGQALLFSFEYNQLPNLIKYKSDYMDRARGSPTCMNFNSIVIKFVLVEFLISKILHEFSLCTTQLVWILYSTIFSGTKNCTKRGPLYWHLG